MYCGTNQIHIKELCELIQEKISSLSNSQKASWWSWDLSGPQRKQDVGKKNQEKFLVGSVRWSLVVLNLTSGSFRALIAQGGEDTQQPNQPRCYLPYGLGSRLDFV